MSALHAGGVVGAVGPTSDALRATRAVLAAGPAGDAALASGGALGAVTVVAAVAALLAGRALARRGGTVARARLGRLRSVGAALAYLVARAAMAASGWFTALNAVVDTVPGGRTGLGATAVTVAGLLVPVAAPLGVAVGTLPASRALGDGSTRASLRRVAGALLGVTAAATALVLGVTAANPDTATGLGWVGTSALLAVLLSAGSPWVAAVRDAVRAPTAAERERVDRAREAVGLRVVAVHVVETDADGVAATVRGLPGRRHLFVAARLLDELDDDHLEACLALQAARSRRLHPEIRALAVLGPLVVAGALVGERLVLSGVSPAAGAAAALLVGVVELWVGRRLVYRADADAAGRTSREAVLETMQTVAALDAAPAWGRLTALRRMEPPLGHRIDRLRERGPAAAGDD